MTEENARRAANVIVAAAGVTLAIVVVSQPRLRRMLFRLAPVLVPAIRPIHVVAAIAGLASGAAASTGAASTGAASSGPASSDAGGARRRLS